MKKVVLMAVAIFFSGTIVFAAPAKLAVSDTTKTKSAKVQYTCTMHPEVLSDKPGKCPKCDMPLVKKETIKKKSVKKKV